MDEVVTRFSEIRGKLSAWKLRSRIARKHELWPITKIEIVRVEGASQSGDLSEFEARRVVLAWLARGTMTEVWTR